MACDSLHALPFTGGGEGDVKLFFVSWTDIFPVLDDEMLAAYQAGVSEAERVEFEKWLGVSSVKCSVSSGEGALTGGGGARDGDGVVIASSRIHPPLETENLKLETRKSHLVSATLSWKHVNARDPEHVVTHASPPHP
jgi:hypothetical protein